MLQTPKTGDGNIHHVVNKKETLNLKNQIMVKISRSLNARHQKRNVEEINSILEKYKSYCEEKLVGERTHSFGYIVASNNKTYLRITSFAHEIHSTYKSMDNWISTFQTMLVGNYRKLKDRHLIKRKLEKEFAEELKNKTVIITELNIKNHDVSLIINHCDPVRILNRGRDKSEYIDWYNKHVINVLDILRL